MSEIVYEWTVRDINWRVVLNVNQYPHLEYLYGATWLRIDTPATPERHELARLAEENKKLRELAKMVDEYNTCPCNTLKVEGKQCVDGNYFSRLKTKAQEAIDERKG